MATLRLLMLNYEFPPIGGGAGHAHKCLLQQFAGDERLTVDVLTSGPEPRDVTERFADNVTVHRVGIHKKSLHYWRKGEVLEWLLKARPRYRRLLKDNTYDLVHAFFAFPSGWLCYRSRKKLPYIVSLRGSDVPGYNVRLGLDYKLLGGLFHRIWANAAAVVANSQGLRRLALEFTPELSVDVIPNGVDANVFYPRPEPAEPGPIRLLTVCRLIARKRIDLLIQAVHQVRQAGLDAQLTIAGDGNLMESLKELAQQLDCGDGVHFLGRCTAEQMPQIYRDHDVFVMSSAHEGMSNAMLEATASGLPMVTTPCEGMEELVADNGLIVDRAEAGAVAEAIRTLAADPSRLAQMRAAAVEQATRFTWQAVAEAYLKLYGTVK